MKEPDTPHDTPAHGPTERRTLRARAVFAVDAFLYRRGFARGPVRLLARTLILLAALLLALGLAFLPLASWPFWLGAGAVFAAWNFFSMAHFIQRFFFHAAATQAGTKNLMAGQIIRANLRLFITGIFLYTALMHWGANPFALVAGLSLAVLTIPFLPLLERKER